MNDISRRDIEQICTILRRYGDKENLHLADRLEKADIIPRLYQQAYVESLYQRTKDAKTPYQFKQKAGSPEWYLSAMIWENNARVAVSEILNKAHGRQNEICDFDDSLLPQHRTGRCDYENHYENNNEGVELTEEQQEEWDDIHEEHGWNEAWDKFIDIINPDNQKLTLVLNYGEDETKCNNDDGQYVCETCMEEIIDNSDGAISCDMEMADE